MKRIDRINDIMDLLKENSTGTPKKIGYPISQKKLRECSDFVEYLLGQYGGMEDEKSRQDIEWGIKFILSNNSELDKKYSQLIYNPPYSFQKN